MSGGKRGRERESEKNMERGKKEKMKGVKRKRERIEKVRGREGMN